MSTKLRVTQALVAASAVLLTASAALMMRPPQKSLLAPQEEFEPRAATASLPRAHSHPVELSGFWQLPSGSSLQLDPDGTAHSQAKSITRLGDKIEASTHDGEWGVQGSRIYLTLDHKEIVAPMELKGDRLTLLYGNVPVSYTRR